MAKATDAETEKIKRLLPAVTGKQVKAFVKKMAQKDPGFRKELCAWLEKQFVPTEADSADDLKTMVKQMFLSTPKKTIHYSRWESESTVDWHTIAKKAGVLMVSAEDMLKKGNAASAAALAMEFLEQTAAYIGKGYLVDECEYDLPDVAEQAADILTSATDTPDFSRETKQQLLPRIEAIAPFDQYSGLHLIDFEAMAYHIRAGLLPESEVLAILDQQIAEEKRDSTKADLIRRKRDFLCEHGRESEVPELLQTHLTIPEIRREWADYLVQHKRYEEAMQTVEEGIRICDKEGIGTDWWLSIKARYAEKRHDVPRMIEAHRSLFLNYGGNLNDYHKLKSLIPTAEWPAFAKKLTEEVTARGTYNTTALASVYLEEGHEEKLPEMLAAGAPSDMDFLCRFAPKLSEKNVRPFLDQFRQDIRRHAHRSTTRGDYKAMVDYLRRMRQVHGGEACVAELVAEFRRDYCRRRAMMEELDKL